MKRVLRSQADYQQTLLRNQLTSLILFEAVTTTRAKAAKLAAFANRFFSRVKTADLTAKRLAHQTLFDQNAVKKTFEELLPRYNNEDSSFVKVLRVMPRAGDAAEQRLVSLQKPLQATSNKTAAVKPVAAKPSKPKTIKK